MSELTVEQVKAIKERAYSWALLDMWPEAQTVALCDALLEAWARLDVRVAQDTAWEREMQRMRGALNDAAVALSQDGCLCSAESADGCCSYCGAMEVLGETLPDESTLLVEVAMTVNETLAKLRDAVLALPPDTEGREGAVALTRGLRRWSCACGHISRYHAFEAGTWPHKPTQRLCIMEDCGCTNYTQVEWNEPLDLSAFEPPQQEAMLRGLCEEVATQLYWVAEPSVCHLKSGTWIGGVETYSSGRYVGSGSTFAEAMALSLIAALEAKASTKAHLEEAAKRGED